MTQVGDSDYLETTGRRLPDPAPEAAETEIEVTAAMIEAGGRELRWFNPAEDSPEGYGETLVAIYRSMRRAASL